MKMFKSAVGPSSIGLHVFLLYTTKGPDSHPFSDMNHGRVFVCSTRHRFAFTLFALAPLNHLAKSLIVSGRGAVLVCIFFFKSVSLSIVSYCNVKNREKFPCFVSQ